MTEEKKLTVPTVHLNGTSRERLLEAYDNADDALLKALNALKETHPNGRDYYVQGPGGYNRAVDEHIDRIARIHLVRAEIQYLSNAVYEQGE